MHTTSIVITTAHTPTQVMALARLTQQTHTIGTEPMELVARLHAPTRVTNSYEILQGPSPKLIDHRGCQPSTISMTTRRLIRITTDLKIPRPNDSHWLQWTCSALPPAPGQTYSTEIFLPTSSTAPPSPLRTGPTNLMATFQQTHHPIKMTSVWHLLSPPRHFTTRFPGHIEKP